MDAAGGLLLGQDQRSADPLTPLRRVDSGAQSITTVKLSILRGVHQYGRAMERRLVTILAADVAGYSRLMEADEERTHNAFRVCLSAITRVVTKHGGRIFGGAGDSVMAEFASPVEALRAAVQIQHDLAEQSLDLPDEGRMQFRIGVNIGDVMADKGDLAGDAVNIAARLQTMAEPGGICISGGVYEHAEGKLRLGFDDLGPCEVKNIARPVRVYRVRSDAPVRTIGSTKPSKGPMPTIAVLPFANLSGDPDQQSLSDSITEDVITELSRCRSFLVAARTSTFAYKGRPVTIRQMRSELGADFIVEGSVRRLGESVRVTVQLIDTETGNHIWSERYDRAAEEAFALQDQVIEAIAGTLPPQLEVALQQRAERKPSSELSAYEHLLMAERLTGDAISAEDDGPTLEHLEKALEIDPTCGRAHAAMGHVYAYRYVTMGSAGRENADKALSDIERALRWSDDDAKIHAYAAGVYLWCGEHGLAEKHIERALALNPNDLDVIFWRAIVTTYLGNPEMSLALYKRVETLFPVLSEGSLIGVIEALYMLKRYSEAIAVAKRIRGWDASLCAEVAACCAQAGDVEQARSAVEKFESIRRQEFDIAASIRIHVAMCRYPEDREHWLAGYRRAGFGV